MKTLILTLVISLAASIAQAQNSQSLIDALRSGGVEGSFRLRHEAVAVRGVDDAALATTIRSALGYRTGSFRRFSGYLEAEAVGVPFGDESYANIGAGGRNNGVTGRPVIADPAGVDINQAYLRFVSGGLVATVGRQEILFGDVRFVGNVGWRQNHQSFDAARLSYNAQGRAGASYAFIRETQQITGAQAAMRSHVAEASVELGEYGTLVAHGFLLDWLDAPALSTATFGGRFFGSYAAGESVTIVYDLAYANQVDAFPQKIEADYLHLSGGAKFKAVTVKIGREALSGSAAGGAFRSPLATLHKFNGWADQFLGTPTDGLVDLYVSAAATLGGFEFLAVLHKFTAESTNESYGSEVDLRITRSFSAGPSAGAKLATYMEDGRGADVTKLWVWVGIGF